MRRRPEVVHIVPDRPSPAACLIFGNQRSNTVAQRPSGDSRSPPTFTPRLWLSWRKETWSSARTGFPFPGSQLGSSLPARVLRTA